MGGRFSLKNSAERSSSLKQLKTQPPLFLTLPSLSPAGGVLGKTASGQKIKQSSGTALTGRKHPESIPSQVLLAQTLAIQSKHLISPRERATTRYIPLSRICLKQNSSTGRSRRQWMKHRSQHVNLPVNYNQPDALRFTKLADENLFHKSICAGN